MFKWTVAFIDRLFALCGALLCSQLPQLMQDYMHELSGHVHELEHQIGQLTKTAALSNLTFKEYTAKFVDSSDPIFSGQGLFMQGLSNRFQMLSTSLQELKEAGPLAKPILFIQNFNSAIAKEAWESFQPSLPLTIEGAIYAAIGLCLGGFLFTLLRKTAGIIFRQKPPSTKQRVQT